LKRLKRRILTQDVLGRGERGLLSQIEAEGNQVHDKAVSGKGAVRGGARVWVFGFFLVEPRRIEEGLEMW
jgi:hypothetical protein